MKIKAVKQSEREQMFKLFKSIVLFTDDEREVVQELLDVYFNNPAQKDYLFFVTDEENGEFSSFICFGPTPMTEGTFDLYWIGTNPKYEKKGLARKLFEYMIEEMRKSGGHLMRVETSGKEAYGGTVAFYDKLNFTEEARLRDFYAKGDDLIIYTYRI